MERITSLHAMHLQPSPSWYLFDAEGADPLRLLDDDGRAQLALSGTPQGVLASLAEALHDAGRHLTETQFRHLEPSTPNAAWQTRGARRPPCRRIARSPRGRPDPGGRQRHCT
jgi:hypothetical protein